MMIRERVADAWYVVHTRARQEFRALEQLQNQGYCCFLPTLEVRQVAGAAAARARIEPLFARYLFIRLNLLTSKWAPICSTRGVNRLVKFGEHFATLADECVAALQAGPRQVRHGLNAGEPVTIVAGPFAGLEGIYQEADGEVRALVLIELMHQPQRLSLPVQGLRRAG